VEQRAPEAAAVDPRSDPAFRVATTRGGTFTVAWRALGPGLRKNEQLELEVFLYEGDRPLEGAQLAVSGWMPDHGHGMRLQPRAVETGGGRYLVSGVLLHMRGRWQLSMDVERGGSSERAEFELELR
jgi:YtkA-like protein